MNISGPAAVAKPEMLFYAPGDLTVTFEEDFTGAFYEFAKSLIASIDLIPCV